MAQVSYGRGYVYSIKYHVVWCTRYRYKVISNHIEKRLKELLHDIAGDNGFAIKEMKTDLDYIHILIDCKPQHYIPNMIKALKGVSARLLLKEYPELKEKLWKGHLWNPSYFVATENEYAQKQIMEYINSQNIMKK